ncbi:MAG: NADPH:quinone oxidoreductase family protein [Saprospiraceae bacterium]|nr:NADPH:quinone oxidoreductase family protein [Saprospiraceae bacterium]
MKAILCREFGPPSNLIYEEVPRPVPGPGQVLVKVAACSINFPDTLILRGRYQFKPEFPFSPGSNIAGQIIEVGDKVNHLKPGDEIIAIMIAGGLAEYAVVDVHMCVPKPASMDMETGAAFLYTYSTSFYALQSRAQLKAGETVLILGASGGVGMSSIEIAKALGATVIAAASSDKKLGLCSNAGADHLINYEKEDLKERAKALTEGRGVDVVLDPVGGKYAQLALRAISWEGRYLVVGFAAGEIPKIPLNLVLLKSCQLVGVFLGAFSMHFPKERNILMKELLDLYEQGKFKPYIHKTFSLEEAPQALQMMENREAAGKLVIKVS